MVLVFSGNSNSSQQVLREVERAVNRGIPIVPFRIENLMPSKAMEYFISADHWLDAYHPPLDGHLEKLSHTCNSLLTGAELPRAEGPKNLKAMLQSAVKTLASRDNRTRVLIGAAALLLLIGVMIVGAVYGLKDPKASPEVISARSQAAALGEKLARIDREQGFVQPLDEVNQKLKTGETLFGEKKFDKAKIEFDAALTQGAALVERDEHRQAARKARADLGTAIEQGKAQKLPDATPVVWAKILQSQQSADASFNEGDFAASLKSSESGRTLLVQAGQAAPDAAGLITTRDALLASLKKPVAVALETDSPADFQAIQKLVSTAAEAHSQGRSAEALTTYQEATKRLRAATMPRKKALALRLGFACCHLEIADAASKWKPAPGFDGSIKRDANEFRIDSTAWAGIIENECKKELDVNNEAIDRFVRQPGNFRLLDGIGDVLLQSPSLGPEVMVAFWLGSDLATIKIFTEAWTSGPSDTFRLFNTNRNRMPDYDGLIAWVHRAGAPVDVLSDVLNTDELKIAPAPPTPGGGLRPGTGSPFERKLRDIMKLIYDDHLSSVDRATQFFFRYQKNQPTIAGKEIEIEKLRDRGVNLYFQGKAPNLKLIAAAFSPAMTDEDLAHLKSFDTLQYLWLTDTAITDKGLEIVRQFKSLAQLSLSRCKATEVGVRRLTGLSQISILYLNGLPISDDFASVLKDFQSLKEVYLSKTQMTDKGYSEIQKTLPNLRYHR